MKACATVFLSSILVLTSARAGLQEIENQYRTAYELGVTAKHAAAVSEMDRKYAEALERALEEAGKAGRLEEAVAYKAEIQRIKGNSALPANDDDVTPALAKFRNTYREQLDRLVKERERTGNPIVQQFGMALVAYQNELTQAGNLDEALVVKEYIASGIYKRLTGQQVAMKVAAATPQKPFENSLGMKFVPMEAAGKKVFFCIHETRWKDFQAFAKNEPEIAGTAWENQTIDGWTPTERLAEHPVVRVDWDNAMAFCAWLSKKEKRIYRLPTDHEWSVAVGIGDREDTAATPEAKRGKVACFPWGTAWPPPSGAGNYSDQSRKAKAPVTDTQRRNPYLDGYDDGFPTTAPVMSFSPNQFGIYDLGGNVREWVQDFYNSANQLRVLRDAAWWYTGETSLNSSVRWGTTPTWRLADAGFRVVLE